MEKGTIRGRRGKLTSALSRHNFEQMLDVFSNKCVWASQWVLQPRAGKQTLTEYYREKGRLEGLRVARAWVLVKAPVGKSSPDSMYMNGEAAAKPCTAGLFIPEDTLGVISVQ